MGGAALSYPGQDIFMEEESDWTKDTERKEKASIEIGLLLTETFNYGPDYIEQGKGLERLETDLYKPEVPRYGDFVLCGEAKGHEEELFRYYRNILRLCKKHGKSPWLHKHYFWIRPIVYSRGDFSFTFPWYDTLAEAKWMIERLSTRDEGEVAHDMDQSWEFQAFTQSDRLYVRERDPESGEVNWAFDLPRGSIQKTAVRAVEEADALIGYLTKRLGANYWDTAPTKELIRAAKRQLWKKMWWEFRSEMKEIWRKK